MGAINRFPFGLPEKAGRTFGKPLCAAKDRVAAVAIPTPPTGRGRRDSLYRWSSTLTVR